MLRPNKKFVAAKKFSSGKHLRPHPLESRSRLAVGIPRRRRSRRPATQPIWGRRPSHSLSASTEGPIRLLSSPESLTRELAQIWKLLSSLPARMLRTVKTSGAEADCRSNYQMRQKGCSDSGSAVGSGTPRCNRASRPRGVKLRPLSALLPPDVGSGETTGRHA